MAPSPTVLRALPVAAALAVVPLTGCCLFGEQTRVEDGAPPEATQWGGGSGSTAFGWGDDGSAIAAIVVYGMYAVFGVVYLVGYGVDAATDEIAPPLWGVESQVYPAGTIAGLHLQFPLGWNDFVTMRIAGNFTDRGDWGEQDDEQGAGFGGGFGYRSYLGPEREGWVLGLRGDLWWLDVDWTDDVGLATEASGSTDVLVLQPTAELGYGWDMGSWRLELMAGFGYEINLATDGREVGEGPIGLLGLTLVADP